VLGLAGSGLYVVAIWLLARFDLAPTFHGPRYPVLAVHLWSAGLVCLAVRAAEVSRRHPLRMRWVVLAFVPWLVASGIGQVRLARAEHWGALSELRALAGAAWPDPGEPIYIMPPELAPFYRGSLQALDVRRIERLPCVAASGRPATVLDVNFWKSLDRSRDHLVRAVLRDDRFASSVQRFAVPPEQPALVLYRVEGLDAGRMHALCRRGLEPPLRDRMAASVAEALPEDQREPEGWSYLEVSPELELYRWSTASRVPVRFDRAVETGEYLLHVVGYRSNAPRPAVSVGFELQGTSLTWQRVLPEGRFHLCRRVVWPGGDSRRGDVPVLLVEHPIWPAGGPEATGGRNLGFLFYAAWWEPAPERNGEDEGCDAPHLPAS
jgi:hypothetical protein